MSRRNQDNRGPSPTRFVPGHHRRTRVLWGVLFAAAANGAVITSCLVDQPPGEESLMEAPSPLATTTGATTATPTTTATTTTTTTTTTTAPPVADAGAVFPPGWDAAVPFESCGLVPPPNTEIVWGAPTCGHAELDVNLDVTCKLRIDLNPVYCGGMNFCCVLYHEMLHIQHFQQVCDLCATKPPADREACIRCTESAISCFSEATAQGQGAAWCRAHDPDGNEEFSVGPAKPFIPLPPPHQLQCQGLGNACSCVRQRYDQNPGLGGHLPPDPGCEGKDMSGDMTFPPLHEMCPCGQICENIGLIGCSNGFCEDGKQCGICPDCEGQSTCACLPPNNSWCQADCPICGDGQCRGEEACDTCPGDCGTCNVCGNHKCDPKETSLTCPADCPEPVTECDGGPCVLDATVVP